MELSDADRICLSEAEEQGRLAAPVMLDGRVVPEGAALKRHLDGMVQRGLMAPADRSDAPGRQVFVYRATEAGLELGRAMEARDQAIQLLADCRGALATGGNCEARLTEVQRVLSGPRWRALLKAAEPAGR